MDTTDTTHLTFDQWLDTLVDSATKTHATGPGGRESHALFSVSNEVKKHLRAKGVSTKYLRSLAHDSPKDYEPLKSLTALARKRGISVKKLKKILHTHPSQRPHTGKRYANLPTWDQFRTGILRTQIQRDILAWLQRDWPDRKVELRQREDTWFADLNERITTVLGANYALDTLSMGDIVALEGERPSNEALRVQRDNIDALRAFVFILGPNDLSRMLSNVLGYPGRGENLDRHPAARHPRGGCRAPRLDHHPGRHRPPERQLRHPPRRLPGFTAPPAFLVLQPGPVHGEGAEHPRRDGVGEARDVLEQAELEHE